MRRRVALLPPFIAAALLVANIGTQGQEPDPPTSTQRSVAVRSTDVAELRTWDAFVTQASRSGELRLRSTDRDPLLPQRTVERFEQFHNGVRIWGADIVRDSERGVPHSLFGELVLVDPQISTTPTLSIEAARGALLLLGGEGSVLLIEPEVVFSRLDNGDLRLAYTAVVSGNGDVVRAFVDAGTGTELMRYTEIQRQQASVGSGRGVLGDSKKISVESSGGTFIALDRLRPPIIRTFDLGGDPVRFDAVEAGRRGLSASDLARDADNVWTDVAIVDAQTHVGMAYDYFFKRFGRSGIDGRNAPINILANALSQQGALLLPASALSDYAINANWCPSCLGGQGRLWFGNGIPQGYSYNGQNVTYTAGALDTVAHELTHAVTTYTSNLIYRNESGALNESFSDIMGKGAEFFYRQPGSGVGQADYVFSKDTDRAVQSGAQNGIRSLSNPGLFGHPDHYSRLYRGTQDGGGVHSNSGISNHAFYLAIEGGANRTSGLTVQGVGSANREQIEKVFFRAFTLSLPASATFSMARIATIQAARDLYGAGSTVERAVTQAWDAVGVTNTSSSTTRMTTFTGNLVTRTGVYYAVTMPATGRYQAVLNWSDSGVDLDLMLSRPGCLSYSCLLTRAESATRRPEFICWDVRAGEQYWIIAESYGPRTTSYELSQAILPAGSTCSASSALSTGGAKTDGDALANAKRLN